MSDTKALTTTTANVAPFEPRNLVEAERLADRLATSGLMPDALRGKPNDVLVVLISGHELGLSPMQAIRSIHVVKGRPVMAAELLVALVKQRPAICRYFRMVESTDQKAIYETHRVGEPEPTRMEWTIEQATKAGLAGRDNWKTHAGAMLRARCSASLVRAVYPDLSLGVVAHEEMDPSEIHQPAAGFSAPVVQRPPAAAVVDVEPVPDREPGEDDGDEPTVSQALADARAALDRGEFKAAVDIGKNLADGEKAMFRSQYATAKKLAEGQAA